MTKFSGLLRSIAFVLSGTVAMGMTISAPRVATAGPSCVALFVSDSLPLPDNSRSVARSLLAFPEKPAIRPLHTIQSIRLMTYNVKQLLFRTRGNGKPKHEIVGIAKAIRDSAPDIVTVQEVRDLATLRVFVDQYLDGLYEAILTPGNSERGIEIGFLIKKDIPLDSRLESNRHVMWTDPFSGKTEPLFSRDLPVLSLYRKGDTAHASPLLVVIGNHGKSKRSRPGDPESRILRSAQYQSAGKIIDSLLFRYGPDIPLVLAGDFNTNIADAPEIKPVKQRLFDPFDILDVPAEDHVTHTFHPKGRRAEFNQLDAIFVAPALRSSILNVEVYRYKNIRGEVKALPNSFRERSQNPSDHFPVIVDLSTELIFPEAHEPRFKKAQ